MQSLFKELLPDVEIGVSMLPPSANPVHDLRMTLREGLHRRSLLRLHQAREDQAPRALPLPRLRAARRAARGGQPPPSPSATIVGGVGDSDTGTPSGA